MQISKYRGKWPANDGQMLHRREHLKTALPIGATRKGLQAIFGAWGIAAYPKPHRAFLGPFSRVWRDLGYTL